MRSQAVADKKPGLGSALREIRRERGWTIATMSEVTGFSIATLSKVENDRRSLTYDKLSQLAHSLDVDIARLFGQRSLKSRLPMAGRRSVAREGDGMVMDVGVYTYTYLCEDIIDKRFSQIIMDIHARSVEEFGTLPRHDGEEYAFVIEGEVVLYTEAYAPLHLAKGESIYFDSSVGHAFVNGGTGPAKVLNIASHVMIGQDVSRQDVSRGVSSD